MEHEGRRPREARDLLLGLADVQDARDVPRVAFIRELIGRGLSHVRTVRFEADTLRAGDVERVARVELAVCAHASGRLRAALLRLDGGVPAILVSRPPGDEVTVDLAGDDSARLESLAELLRAALRSPAPADDRVEIAFWSAGHGFGPDSRRRRIGVPELGEIAANYPERVRGALDALAGLRPREDLAGRLLLWHGPPGTGKTWALRALAREWRDWCRVECVTDPERFFGGDAGYMLEVLLGDDDGAADADLDDAHHGARWRLLVLEDTGELLSIDARRETGTAFARLLNTVDGLLGQGTRTLLLITTNEPPARFHPALVRPGRALVQIEFAPLDAADARNWLAERGCAATVSGPATIAELHGLLAGRAPARPERRLGFA